MDYSPRIAFGQLVLCQTYGSIAPIPRGCAAVLTAPINSRIVAYSEMTHYPIDGHQS
jgi:hypothetical protein